MANNKLTWLELRKAVVERAHCTEKEAESFLNALLESLNEGLIADKQVKIKGLGIFSLKAIAPRKSVNIATGEDIVIEGYNKVTFNAEAGLKESVEKRIAKPATEKVVEALQNDPMKKLGEQADEIIDLLADLGQAPSEASETKKANDTKKARGEKVSEKKASEKKVSEKKVSEKKASEKKIVAPKVEPAKPEKKSCKCACKSWMCWLIGVVVLAGLVTAGVYYKEQIIGWWQCTSIMNREIKGSKYHDIVTKTKHIDSQEIAVEKKSLNDCWNNLVATINRWDIQGKIESWNIKETIVGWRESIKICEQEEAKEEIIEKVTVPAVPVSSGKEVQPLAPRSGMINTNEGELVYDRMPGIESYYNEEVAVAEALEVLEEAIAETTEVIEEAVAETTEVIEEAIAETVETVAVVEEMVNEIVALADLPRIYTQFIATEVVNKDSRLSWISYKYYGTKDLWVFIYEANRDIIKNPAHISVGLQLRIPKLDRKYMDLSDPELRQLVDDLAAEYTK